jgi:hypothetical protein
MISIGVIGRGTAGIASVLSILHYCKTSDNLQNIKITCIHDPNTPILTVGESASPALVYLMQRVLDFNFENDLNAVDGTVRFGGKHLWEDNLGNPFDVIYRAPGLLINSEKTSMYLVEKLNKLYPNVFFEEHDKIIGTSQNKFKVMLQGEKNQYTFDYVIDSTGAPTFEELNSGDYDFPTFETVNSAIIFPEFKTYKEEYTTNVFHKNGWMFGVPLQHRKAFGYLYNNSITSQEEAIEHFKKIKPEVEVEKLRAITWKHYFRKKAMDGRIFYMGNKLYFFEPAQGLPLHYYITISQFFIQRVYDNDISKIDVEHFVNLTHQIDMIKLQDLIALNYAGTNNMDSEFWKQTKINAVQRLKSSDRFQFFLQITKETTEDQQYWSHPPELMKQYIEGLDVDLKELLP